MTRASFRLRTRPATMGCLFSSEEAASSAPLLDSAPASGAPPKFTKEASASGPSSASAKKVPTFVKKAAAAAQGSAPAKREAGVGLFCQCGGSGSLVVLIPCNHHALCLHCAQFTPACPVCSAAITDSKPSFRVARPAAPSEAAL